LLKQANFMIAIADHPTIRIEYAQQLSPTLAGELGAFLAQAPIESGVCGEHDLRWLSVLRDALGHEPYLLLAREEGAIVGYLPLVLVKSKLFGRFLVSLPYLNRAGVVACEADTAEQLLRQAVSLARRLDVQYLELRQHVFTVRSPAITHEKADKVRMVLDLPSSDEALSQAVGAKVRNQIKKGEKAGLNIRWGGEELLDGFYDVFAVNMRDLGTPVYSRKLFASILHHLKDDAELAVVEHEGQAVAAALLVHDTMQGFASTQVPSASSLRTFNYLNANMWMYDQLLRRAIQRGSAQFDFGRSTPESGTYRFKKQWGAQPQPTTWQYHLRRGELGAMRPDSPKNQRRIATWQKLPVWVTRMVGPSIVRGIP
jgi:FemAB-related protein (PEP-CTERM system-associated)